eukprot:scpid62409/ scgid27102/ 
MDSPKSFILATCLVLLLDSSIVTAKATTSQKRSSRDCVTGMLTRAGITHHVARLYTKILALSGHSPELLRAATSHTLENNGIIDAADQRRIMSCFSSSMNGTSIPGQCQAYQPCEENSRCTLFSKTSNPHFLCLPINYCEEVTCLYGGVCKNTGSNFTCDCAVGYRGRLCEEKWLTKEYTDLRLQKLTASVHTAVESMKMNMMLALTALQSLVEGIASTVSRKDIKPISSPGTDESNKSDLHVSKSPGADVSGTVIPETRHENITENVSYSTGSPTDIVSTRPMRTTSNTGVTATEVFPQTIYVRFPEKRTWAEARSDCAQRGGMLAVANQGNATTDPLFLYLTSHKFELDIWLGGTRENDDFTWRWITGEGIQLQSYASLGAPPALYPGKCVLHYQGYVGGYYRFVSSQIPAPCSERFTSVCQFTVNSSDAKSDPKYHPAMSAPPAEVMIPLPAPTYTLHTEELSWVDAKSACEEQGSHLAVVRNREENDGLISFVLSRNRSSEEARLWFGISQTRPVAARSWKWVTGESPKYAYDIYFSYIARRIGGGACMMYIHLPFADVPVRNRITWNANRCDERFGFVCQTTDMA